MTAAAGQPKIVIQMLGPFEVFRDGVKMRPADFGSRKAKTLLRWLADARNVAVPEDVLLDALWPDAATDKVLRSFRVRVSEARKLLAQDKDPDAPLQRVDNGYMLRTIPGQLETDADQFAALAAEALRIQSAGNAAPLLRQSLDLYRGEYFADDPYTEQWYSARERYHNLFVAAASRLGEIYESQSQYDEGIRLLRRLLGDASRDEGLYRALIRLQYLHGDQACALRTFDECRMYLQSELETKPAPETLRLLKQVLRHEPLDEATPVETRFSTNFIQRPHADPRSPVHSGPRSGPYLQTKWPLLGRQPELGRLQQKIARLAHGNGGVVWLHGPSGIGKTRLLQEAVAGAAQEHNFRTIWIQGNYLNSRIPFAATLDGLQTGLEPGLTSEQTRSLMATASSRLQQLTGWFTDGKRPTNGAIGSKRSSGAKGPKRSSAANAEVQSVGAEAETLDDIFLRQEILGLFEDLAATMPLVCCIDDVQLLDPASRALVLALARRTPGQPLLIVMASRRAPDDDDLGNDLWTTDAEASVMPLEPLTLAALGPLTGRGISTVWTRRWLEQLHAETAGEPLQLVTRLASLKRNNLIDVIDGEIVFPTGLFELVTDAPTTESTATAEHLPGRRDEFQQSWNELEDGERSLLQKAAALGDSLTLQRLERLATKSPDELERTLERLIRQSYFTPGGADADGNTKLSFGHGSIRQRTYQTMARSERMWYHRRIFKLLRTEADATDPHSAVNRTRTVSATAYHALLAEEWEAATRWSLRAAADVKAISPGPEVITLCQQAYKAAQRTSAQVQAELLDRTRWALGEALFRVGSYDEALPLYSALYDAGGAPPPGELGIDRLLLSQRLNTVYLHLNRIDEARGQVDKMFAEAGNDASALGRAHLNLAYLNYRSGQLPKAITDAKTAIVHLQGTPHQWYLATAHHQLALCHWDVSEYGAALENAHKSVDLRRVFGATEYINSLNMVGELYQDLFCTDLAIQFHREALDLALTQGRVVLSIVAWRGLGLNFVHQGRIEKGLQTLNRTWEQVQELDLTPYWHELHLRSLLEANMLAHRPDAVRPLLEQYKRVLGPRESPFLTVFTLALAFLEGRVDEGEAMLNHVQAFWQQTGRRARAAHVLLFAGQELMLHGHAERGRKYLARATEEMDRICTLVPDDVAIQIRTSRQYEAAQRLVEVV